MGKNKKKSNKPDIVIVGAGIIGCALAKYARDEKGYSVVLIDNKQPLSASKCIMYIVKRSWVNKSIEKEYLDGLELLEKYAGSEDIEVMNKGKKDKPMEDFTSYNANNILNEEFIFGTVNGVSNKKVHYTDSKGKVDVLKAKKAVVIAAGAWTNEILKMSDYNDNLPKIENGVGECYEISEKFKMKDKTKAWYLWWIPFKSAVFCQDPNGKTKWFGDGFVAKVPNLQNVLENERVLKARKKLQENFEKYIGKKQMKHVINKCVGIRPYIHKSANHGFVIKQDKNLYSAVGTAKNGLILCFSIAKELIKNIENDA